MATPVPVEGAAPAPQSPGCGGESGFLVPTMPPPSLLLKKKKKKDAPMPSDAQTTSESLAFSCPETPSSSADCSFGVGATVGGVPLTSTTFKNNCATRHSHRIPAQFFDRDKGRKVSLANVSLIGALSPDLFKSCERGPAQPVGSPWQAREGMSSGSTAPCGVPSDASPDRNRLATKRKSVMVRTRVDNEGRRVSRRLTRGADALTDITNTMTSDAASQASRSPHDGSGGGPTPVNQILHCESNAPWRNGTTIMTQTSFSSCNNQTTIVNNHTIKKGNTTQGFDQFKMPLSPRREGHSKPTVAVNRRRSTRLSALDATLRNRTLLSNESPLEARPRRRLSTTARGRRSVAGKVTDTSRRLDTTALAVSPSVMRRHSLDVLSLLNTGNPRQLQQLSLVGPKTAMVIVMHRKFYGEFSSLRNLEDVAGLPKTFLHRFTKANLLVV